MSLLFMTATLLKQNKTKKQLEVDEFWTYVGNKKNKVWLIYAYHRATGEIVTFVWENVIQRKRISYEKSYLLWALLFYSTT